MFILPKVKDRQSGFIDIISAVVLAILLVGTATTTYLVQHGQDIRNFARNCGPDMIYCGGLLEDNGSSSYNPPPAPPTSGGGGGMSQADLDRQAAIDAAKQQQDEYRAQQAADAAAVQAAADAAAAKARADAYAAKVAREDNQTYPSQLPTDVPQTAPTAAPSSEGRCTDGSYNWDYANGRCPAALQPTSPPSGSHEVVIIPPTQAPSTNRNDYKSCLDEFKAAHYSPAIAQMECGDSYPVPTRPPPAGVVVVPTPDTEATRFRAITPATQITPVVMAQATPQPVRIVQSTPQPQPTTNPINPITIAQGIVSGVFGGIMTNPFAPKITPVLKITDVPQQASLQPTTAPSNAIFSWNLCGFGPFNPCPTNPPSTSQPTSAPVAVAQITPVVVSDNIIIPPTSAVSPEPTEEPQATPIVSAAPVFSGTGMLGGIVIPIICRVAPSKYPALCGGSVTASTNVPPDADVTPVPPAAPPGTSPDSCTWGPITVNKGDFLWGFLSPFACGIPAYQEQQEKINESQAPTIKANVEKQCGSTQTAGSSVYYACLQGKYADESKKFKPGDIEYGLLQQWNIDAAKNAADQARMNNLGFKVTNTIDSIANYLQLGTQDAGSAQKCAAAVLARAGKGNFTSPEVINLDDCKGVDSNILTALPEILKAAQENMPAPTTPPVPSDCVPSDPVYSSNANTYNKNINTSQQDYANKLTSPKCAQWTGWIKDYANQKYFGPGGLWQKK